jgi:DNA-binding response OmpR family regulator
MTMGMSEEDKLRKENRALKDRISFLEEQILQLKEMIIPTGWQAPKIFKLTHFEAIVLEALYNSETPVTRKRMIDVLYYFRNDGDMPSGNTIEVFMSRLRRKTRKFNIEIETLRSRGYELTPESREILKNMGHTRPEQTSENVEERVLENT